MTATRPPCRPRAPRWPRGRRRPRRPRRSRRTRCPPSPPDHHRGQRRLRGRRPAELSLGVRDAELDRLRLVRARGGEPGRAPPDQRRPPRRRAPPARQSGGPVEVAIDLGHVGGGRQARPQRVGRHDLRHLLGALRGLERALRGEVVGRGHAHAVLRDDADAQLRVLAERALVDLGLGEPREPAPVVHEQDLDAVHAVEPERGLGHRAEAVGPDQPRHQRTPTWTSRNRAGDAPCPTRPTWPGCPFPQFGVPQTTHSSRPPTASHEPQNSGVSPV